MMNSFPSGRALVLAALGALPALGASSKATAAVLPMTALKPSATIELGGSPDWMVLTGDAVWIANAPLKALQRIDPRDNRVAAKVALPAVPCSGLAVGFGSIWVPLAGAPRSLARVDPARNRVTAILPIGSAEDEGGITVSDDSVWIVGDKQGSLLRIDPISNTVRQTIAIAPGSFNPLFSDGIVWVTGNQTSVLTAVDADSGEIVAVIPVGPQPRFLAAGADSIWTLNQGDGSVTRVDVRRRRVTATIPARSPGHGGEISFGAGSVWTTVKGVPLTRIDARSGEIIGQWVGDGGDSVRCGQESVWLTDYHRGLLWRLPLSTAGLGSARQP